MAVAVQSGAPFRYTVVVRPRLSVVVMGVRCERSAMPVTVASAQERAMRFPPAPPPTGTPPPAGALSPFGG